MLGIQRGLSQGQDRWEQGRLPGGGGAGTEDEKDVASVARRREKQGLQAEGVAGTATEGCVGGALSGWAILSGRR